MKALLFCLLFFFPLSALFAQSKGVRHYGKKAQAAQQRNQETARAVNQAPEGAPQRSQSQQPKSQQQSGVIKATGAVPQKTADEKQEVLQRTIDSQRKRAEKGDAVAQYDYGMRFLRGEGVEKNQETGLKWLRLSGGQGNSMAKRQLEEIDKKESEAVWAKEDEADKKTDKKKK